jgi:hypothetical protein
VLFGNNHLFRVNFPQRIRPTGKSLMTVAAAAGEAAAAAAAATEAAEEDSDWEWGQDGVVVDYVMAQRELALHAAEACPTSCCPKSLVSQSPSHSIPVMLARACPGMPAWFSNPAPARALSSCHRNLSRRPIVSIVSQIFRHLR